MPTNFPASDDVFDVPSTPVTTPLGSSGDAARAHTASHRDLGDALMAMQAQATLEIHSHDGTTFRHGSKLAQANTHQSVDTDSSTSALHHTIGAGANQYAAGTHTHPAVATYPVGAYFFSTVSTNPATLGVLGTWTAVGQRFLCATGGSLSLTVGATGGSNSHTHTIDASTNTLSSHTHDLTSTTTGLAGGHSHTGGSIGSTSVGHWHPLASASSSTSAATASDQPTSISVVSHGHSQSSTTNQSHSHSGTTVNSTDNHSHTISSSATGSGGSHSHTNSSPQSANNLIPLFVVYMWKRVS